MSFLQQLDNLIAHIDCDIENMNPNSKGKESALNISKNNESKLVEEIILQLFEIGAIKFGQFTLKSGIQSPIYIDLRLIISYPKLLSKVSDFVWSKVHQLKCDVICGVPYTALPIATCISVKYEQPMIMKRKETKKYGTKKQIEGVYKSGQKCLIIEDLVTSGTSVLETVNTLNNVGLKVTDAVVLINREQGGEANLNKNKINLHACYTITTMLNHLLKHKKIDSNMVTKVQTFLKENSAVKATTETSSIEIEKRLTFQQRSDLCDNKIAKKLLQIMDTKKTNLCCSADVRTVKEVLELAEKVGDHICLLKTHVDIITDYTPDFIKKLQKIANEKNFLIFEDRKFADIGNTVKSQFGAGIYKIADWAHITNCHSVPGPGIIDGLKQVSQEKDDEKSGNVSHGLLLLAEMSSKGNLATGEYTKTTIKWAEDNSDFVIGFICRSKLSQNPKLINMTPGVHLKAKSDNLGQVFLTPDKVIGENGSDIIIVGRGIYKADDPLKAAQLYRDAAWTAYQDSLN